MKIEILYVGNIIYILILAFINIALI